MSARRTIRNAHTCHVIQTLVPMRAHTNRASDDASLTANTLSPSSRLARVSSHLFCPCRPCHVGKQGDYTREHLQRGRRRHRASSRLFPFVVIVVEKRETSAPSLASPSRRLECLQSIDTDDGGDGDIARTRARDADARARPSVDRSPRARATTGDERDARRRHFHFRLRRRRVREHGFLLKKSTRVDDSRKRRESVDVALARRDATRTDSRSGFNARGSSRRFSRFATSHPHAVRLSRPLRFNKARSRVVHFLEERFIRRSEKSPETKHERLHSVLCDDNRHHRK